MVVLSKTSRVPEFCYNLFIFLSKCEVYYYNHISLKENPFLELLITLQIYYAAAGLG